MKPFHSIALAAACTGVVLLGWAVSGDSAIQEAAASLGPGATAPPAALAAAAGAAAVDKIEKPRTRDERTSLSRRLAADLAGAGDLLQTLKQLERLCGSTAPGPCLDEVLTGLSAPQRQTLTDILARLPLLGPRLSTLLMSTGQPMLDRIDAISRMRAEVLGAANAQLLFGRQEAQLRYQAQLEQFIERDAARLPLAQRLAAAETLRAPLLQHDTAPSVDDPNERARQYQLTLRLTLLDATDEADRARLSAQVRSQFFPPEQVAQLARNDRFDAQQRDRMATYAERKLAIQARYTGADTPAALQQRDAELDALRREVFPDSFQP
ncbi:MAG TPA: lipase secretion chaperone [Ideonella sp.]|uniref:lipase secretion chaperone n=1 Tax=Ideonella sp. TaxID=1929293 RepID=UPI002E34348C|nr:lipase secretion chaperone [Ideonella sp.]HEX5684337.1 lipase secretion chaperone [Ideonella sp.]